MKALICAFLAMICWGIAPVFGKLGLRGIDPVTALYVRTIIAASIAGGWLFASGQVGVLQSVSPRTWVFLGVEGLFASLLGDVAYLASLKWGNTGEVFTISAAAPFVTIVLASLILKESISTRQILGSTLIVLGLWLVSASALAK